MTEKERNLLYGVVSLILPENILDQFDIVRLEDEDNACLLPLPLPGHKLTEIGGWVTLCSDLQPWVQHRLSA